MIYGLVPGKIRLDLAGLSNHFRSPRSSALATMTNLRVKTVMASFGAFSPSVAAVICAYGPR
ncbi:MAG: hypothetical protein P3W94_008205 [Paracoccus sp. (in: a-proteobacteria)]|nr:hypothetical protein [Paracoccus sp. (in: a-proteobacteria)]